MYINYIYYTLYYIDTKLTSFQRQLNLYGFRRMNKGEYQGAYFHPKFIENRKDLLTFVKRVSTKNNNNNNNTNNARQVNSSPLITEADGINSLTNLLNGDYDDNLDIGLDDFDTTNTNTANTNSNPTKKMKTNHNPYGNNANYNSDPNTIPLVIPKNITNHVPNLLPQVTNTNSNYTNSNNNNKSNGQAASVPASVSVPAKNESSSQSQSNDGYEVPQSNGYEQTRATDIYTTNSNNSNNNSNSNNNNSNNSNSNNNNSNNTYKSNNNVVPLPQHPMVMTHTMSPRKMNGNTNSNGNGIAGPNNHQYNGVPLPPSILQPSPSRGNIAPLSMPYLFRGISVNTQDELRNLLASNSFATSNTNSITMSSNVNEPIISGFGTNIGKPPPNLNRYQSDLLLGTDIEQPCIDDKMIANIEFIDKTSNSPVRTPSGLEIASTPGKAVRQSSNLDLLSAVAFHRSTSKDGTTPSKGDLNLNMNNNNELLVAPVSLTISDEPLSLSSNDTNSLSLSTSAADDDIWRQDARK